MPAGDSEKRHPIQVVADRTGLTKDLLRAWERRYGVVHPARTDTGRRRYSDEDVERLRTLKAVTDAGRAIGQVADLTLDELTELALEDAAERASTGASRAVNAMEPGTAHYSEAVQATLQLDSTRLRRVVQRAMLLLPPADVIDGVLSPLLEEVGKLWAEGRLSVAHEHAATSVLRVTIAEAVDKMKTGRFDAPHVVVATPAGQRHDLGALLVAATATAAGCQVTFLGADLPAEDIANAARDSSADLIALSIVHPADDPDLPAELTALRHLVSPDVPIVAGGRASGSYRGGPARSAVQWMDDLGELRELLEKMMARGSTII